MVKTDGRHYNRRANRDLALEMDLWIAFQNKPVRAVSTGIDRTGVVTDIKLERVSSKTLRAQVTLDGTTTVPMLICRRKIVGLTRVANSDI